MTTIIVPAVMLSAVIWVSLQLAKDEKLRKEKRFMDSKIKHQIEANFYKKIKEKADFWDNFNTELYVKILEKK